MGQCISLRTDMGIKMKKAQSAIESIISRSSSDSRSHLMIESLLLLCFMQNLNFYLQVYTLGQQYLSSAVVFLRLPRKEMHFLSSLISSPGFTTQFSWLYHRSVVRQAQLWIQILERMILLATVYWVMAEWRVRSVFAGRSCSFILGLSARCC